jgi:heterotetrameric sarcosine oxidase beta subunit
MRIGGKESEGVALSGMDMSLWDKTALYKLHSFPFRNFLLPARKATMRYSILELARQALSRHRGWKPAWRDAQPRDGYDIVIVGGGGHGLATAFYLASVHGLTRVAVVERGWIGGGNAGRNTTIIRSNYGLPGNEPFYEWAMKLWEGLEQTLNYNAMVSQRGVLNLCHSDAQRDAYARRGNAMRLHGVDSELLDVDGVRRLAPFLDFDNARFPSRAACCSRAGAPRGMTRSTGAMPGRLRIWASTSSRIAKSPGS